MRLIRCDLRAFGQFKNCKLELDPTKNFHFIYGDNESGKTTFTRAFLALMFGIEKNTRDAYLNSVDHLFLEGLLESHEGKHYQITREHRLSRKLNLQLQNLFPHINKAIYMQNFILNDGNLQEGSKNLLVHLKQFDVAFFQNATGIHQVKNAIKKLEKRSEELFKLRGTKPSLNENLALYKSLIEKQKRVILSFPEYHEKKSKLESLEEEKKRLLLDRNQLNKKREQIQLFTSLRKSLFEYCEVKNELKNLELFLSSFKLQASFDQSHWIELKGDLNLLLKQKLIQETQLSSLESKIKTLKVNLERIDEKSACAPFEPNLESLISHYHKVENSSDIEKKEKHLLNQIKLITSKIYQKLNLWEIPIENMDHVLRFQFPSRIEVERVSEMEYQIQSQEKNLSFEQESLIKQESKIQQKIDRLSTKGNFDLDQYRDAKTKRDRLGKKIESNWEALSKNELKLFFSEYQSFINHESQFTNLLISETDSFIEYRALEGDLKRLKDLQIKNKQSQVDLELLKKEQFKVINFYQLDWSLDLLTYDSFKEIAEQLPLIQKEIHLLKGLDEELKLLTLKLESTHQILKEVLQEEYSPKKDLVVLLSCFSQILDKKRKSSDKSQELIKQKQVISHELQSSSNLLKAQKVERDIITKNTLKFFEKHQLDLKLEESQIEKFIQRMDTYLLKKKEKSHIQNHILQKKEKDLLELFTKVETNEFILNSGMACENFEQLIQDPERLKQFGLELKSKSASIEKVEQELSDLHLLLSKMDQEVGKITFQIAASHDRSQKKEIESEFQELFYNLETDINEYITTELSLFLLKKQIRLFQEKNQEPLIQKTSEFFKKLTGGAYQRVVLNILDQESFLTCKSKDVEVPLTQLSRGTQDQLFLALKLALIEQYTDGKEPLPIILDDILVQFDDSRAINTLKVLSSLTTKTQILFLTHNAHILELVKQNLNDSDYQIHNLESKARNKEQFITN